MKILDFVKAGFGVYVGMLLGKLLALAVALYLIGILIAFIAFAASCV